MSEEGSCPLRRVVITGLGVVAPNGIGKEAFWQACISGISGVRSLTRFDASSLPARIAGEVLDFDPLQYGLTADEAGRMDRGTQFALASAHLALEDAGITYVLSEEERERMGVYMGSAMAYVEEGERIWQQATDNGTSPPMPIDFDRSSATLLMTHACAASIAAHASLYGPCMLIATGCSAGADAIGEAFWVIQEGRADRMLAGGSDSALSPIGMDVFCVMGALSTHFNEEPERASRPYDQQRDGFVMAEGAAVMLLEEREIALARGAYIYAELLTFASNTSAHHMTALPDDGAPLQQLLRQVLAETGITQQISHSSTIERMSRKKTQMSSTPAHMSNSNELKSQIASDCALGYISSHGSSTRPNDRAETAAYKAVFGEYAYHIPISATKSMIGHTQGAASAIEALVTALVIDRQLIPPTLNQEQNDPLCDLDYVPNVARSASIHVALTHSSGFGGVNSALILARPEWAEQHGR